MILNYKLLYIKNEIKVAVEYYCSLSLRRLTEANRFPFELFRASFVMWK